jgi:predicted TIM-barrel fold metal-dependent hydrolase
MSSVEVIDAQVHVVDFSRPVDPSNLQYPAAPASRSAPTVLEVTGPQMVAAMDSAGVDAALLANPSHCGWDNSYSLEVAESFPERFRVVGLLDHNAADIADRIERWATRKETAGLRVLIANDVYRDQLVGGAFEPYLDAVARWHVPVCMNATSYRIELDDVVRGHPDVQFVVDHFGIGVVPENVSQYLPAALQLAQYPNVAVKLTGGPALTEQAFPFEDLWPVIDQFVARFGRERLMWGTDWTRVPNGTYPEGVRYVLESDRLSQPDKAAIMGGTLRRIFDWR